MYEVCFCIKLMYLERLIASKCRRKDFASSPHCCQTFYRKLFHEKFNNLFIHERSATEGYTVKMA
jgi:hypothetical protein